MDLHLVVAGLLTRHAGLCTLLLNYATRLEHVPAAPGRADTSRFIVPTWDDGAGSSAAMPAQILTVEVHSADVDPACSRALDVVLDVLHAVLTDEHAGRWITTRRLGGSAGLEVGDLGTVYKAGAWEIAPRPSSGLPTSGLRLLPWPDCAPDALLAGVLPGAGHVGLN